MIRKGVLEITSIYGISLALVLFFIANIASVPELCVIYLTIMSVSLIPYFISDFSKKIGICFFCVCFFTFLISGAILPYYLNESDWMKGFSSEEYIIACNCLFVSIIALLMGYIFATKYKVVFGKASLTKAFFSFLDDNNYIISKVQKISFIVFVVTFFISIVFEMERVVYVVASGYMSLYSGYTTSSFATRALIVNKASFFIGLAAKPSKKRMFQYLILGMVVPIMEFIIGTRAEMITFLLFAILYMYSYDEFRDGYRSYVQNNRKLIKFIIYMIILAVIALPFLYSYGYTRVNQNYSEAVGLFDGILKFFSTQGNSFSLVGYAVHYDDTLPGTCYSFGAIVDRIQGNNYAAFTVDAALKKNEFGSTITYLVKEYNYLTLHNGMGSSYVAELYYDFEYIGLFIGNFILGMILRFMINYKTNSVITQAFSYMFFYYLLTISRSPLMNPISQIMSISTLATFVIVFALCFKKKTI